MKTGNWKYGLIKVAEDHGEDICELVEIYPPFADNKFPSFCRPFLGSVECLERAMRDVKRDGLNTWFWENGTFHRNEVYFWDWKPNKEINNG